MKEELISFETAKLAKEKGFDIEVLNHYYSTEGMNTGNGKDCDMFMDDVKNSEIEPDEYSAPTQSFLQKWLREKYNLHPYVTPYGDGKNWNVPNIRHNNKDWNEVNVPYQIKQRQFPSEFETYEQGLEFALIEMLKMIP
tara:strand:+ start:39 stop:455 length:417 start_codon:yes stop_codon:yes gene_type:complete